jgi:hypothetical protein
MTADVYAGDDDLRAGRRTSAAPPTRFRYRIEADADADVLGRISNQLNFANSAPWSLDLSTAPDGRIVVNAELRGISDSLAEFIRRKLQQQTCIVAVELYVPA